MIPEKGCGGDGQKHLDYSLSAARRRLLERLAAVLPSELRCRPVGAGAWLLLAILDDLYAGSKRGTLHQFEATQEGICDRINRRAARGDAKLARIRLRQVKTGIRALRDGFRWVTVTSRKYRRKSLPGLYSVEWPAIERYLDARESEQLPSGDQRRAEPGPQSAVFPPTECSFEAAAECSELPFAEQNCTPLLKDLRTSEDPPPSKGVQPAAGDDWKKAVEGLCSLRIGNWRPLVDDARARDLPASDVLSLIEHFRSRPGAWTVGALYSRIRNHARGLAIADGWVPESPKFRDAQRRAADNQINAERRASDVAAAQKREAGRAALERRERDYGPALDAMGRDDMISLAERAGAIVGKLVREHREKEARIFLLRQIERERSGPRLE